MRLLRATLVLWLAAGFLPLCAAQQASTEESKRKAEQAEAELQQKADHASGAECAKLSMRAARRAMDNADRLFLSGSTQPAHDAIDVSVRYARRSVECSLDSRKYQKSAEIELRGLLRQMNEVARTLDMEERPHMTEAIADLEQERDRLLQSLFGAPATTTRKQRQ